MRAICLLEADYNWLNKFVFAKDMMGKAHQDVIVPVEQFSKRGIQLGEGVLVSSLFWDICRALHTISSQQGVDLANCCDAVAHPMATIALQSFWVRVVMVAMMLSMLQEMDFFFRTAFGQSTITYWDTKDDPTIGLAQGNGAAPPVFLAVSALMIWA